MTRVAVIGSNSFSGSHLVALLLQKGYDVLGCSRSEEPAEPFRPYDWVPKRGSWEFARADLNEPDHLERVLKASDPELVVNFAAQSMVGQSWQFPEHWYQTNVVAVAHLGRILGELPSLRRYVHVTTPEVYGSTDGWIPESEEFHPSTPYAVSRAAGDLHLLALQRAQGLPVVFTRAANVYGPGQQLYRLIPRALLSARLDRRLPLEGGGHSLRSFIHVDDVSRATLAIAEGGTDGLSYHISTDRLVSIRALVAQIAVLTGVAFEALVEETADRVGKDQAYKLDATRLSESFGWAAQVSLESGLKDTLAWVDRHLDTLRDLPTTYEHRR